MTDFIINCLIDAIKMFVVMVLPFFIIGVLTQVCTGVLTAK